MKTNTLIKFVLLFAISIFSCQASAADDFDELLAKEKKIVIAKKRIHLEDYPDAHNPSIIKVEQGYLLAFRYIPDLDFQPWVSYIGVVLLNDAFDPISTPQLLTTRTKYSPTPSQSEDPRLFTYRGRIYVLYNDNIEIINPATWERRDMFMAELICANNQYSLSVPIKLYYEEKYNHVMWQKNWIPFEWNKTFLLTYMIDQHEVIRPNLTNGACYLFKKTTNSISWEYGWLKGSSSAQLVDGEYLAFFHSGKQTISPVSWGWNLWHYFMGAYTFSAEPPFEITKMTPTPIIGEDFYTLGSYYKRVIYPGGFVASGSSIYVAYGKDDSEIWIATLDKAEFKKALKTVKKN